MSHFESALEGLPPESIDATVEFRKLEQWDSIAALNVLAVIDSEYGVQISREELRECLTPQQLFEVVKKKI